MGCNEIVIKIGSFDTQVGKGVHQGHDQEKHEYLPGITDSVSLIFNQSPVVETLQTAPDLSAGSLKAVVSLRNPASEPVTSDVLFEIYEGDALVGSYTQSAVAFAADEVKTVTAEAIAISGFGRDKYWTPDNPYLYTLKITTVGDSYTHRVGMRTFGYDPITRKPLLNGEIYYLRGTNVTINRFYEDASRSDHPWDETWVRALIQQFKHVNFQAARFCVGFPPEMWYDLCDEMGFMVMDEYPYWQLGGDAADPDQCSSETLTEEAKLWVLERNNHASVISFDMQNESFDSIKTSNAIKEARKLDLQDRPWDNGWGLTHERSTDTLESHNYLTGGEEGHLFKLEQLNNMSKLPSAYAANTAWDTHPVILNEYCWMWLDREGNPTSLTQKNWDYRMPGSTADERRIYYADWLAAETEFWRETRNYAGILQFCGLGYSRPNGTGETSDILMPDLSTPRINEYLAERLHSMFSPVGIVIDYYSESIKPGITKTIPVVILNDLNESVALDVDLVLYQNGIEVERKSLNYQVEAFGKLSKTFTVTIPDEEADYKLVAEYTRNSETISSVRKLKSDWSDFGIAVNKPVTVSSDITLGGVHFKSENLNDGDSSTRWASQPVKDAQWVCIDLEDVYDIERIALEWEQAYGSSYRIQTSLDGRSFSTRYIGGASSAGTQEILLDAQARYVKLCIDELPTEWGCSLYEFAVFGQLTERVTGISVKASPQKTTYVLGEEFDYSGIKLYRSYLYRETTLYDALLLEPENFSGFDSSVLGTQTVTVTLDGYTDTFTVTVVQRALSQLAIIPPLKVSYEQGEALDLTGALLTGRYNDGSALAETPVLGSMISGYDPDVLGVQDVTVTYEGINVTFRVTVTSADSFQGCSNAGSASALGLPLAAFAMFAAKLLRR